MLKRSNYLLSLTVFLLAFASASVANAQESQIVETITSEQMRSLFHDQGFSNVEIDSDDDLIVRMQGYGILVFVRGNNYSNIQYRFSVAGTSTTMRDVNDWNRSKKFTKAYLDNDGDPVLEMDVDLDGGVTWKRIEDSILTYNQSLVAFLREVAR